MWINLDLDLNKIKLYCNLRYRQQTAASRLKLPAKNSYTPLVTYLQARAAMTVSRWYVNDSLIGSNEYASDPGVGKQHTATTQYTSHIIQTFRITGLQQHYRHAVHIHNTVHSTSYAQLHSTSYTQLHRTS